MYKNMSFQKGELSGTNIEFNPNRYRPVYLYFLISIKDMSKRNVFFIPTSTS